MARAVQLRGSCLLVVAVFVSLAQPALPERLLGAGSMLLEGAQLAEDLFGPHDTSSARAEFAGFAKAGAVAILAALVGGAGYIETRARGAEARSGSDVAVSLAETEDEAVACEAHGADERHDDAAAGDDREDEMRSEYAGFMDGMYEDTFDSLSAGDLVSDVASSGASPSEAASGAQAVAASATALDIQEPLVASDCPVTGALEEMLAECTRGAAADDSELAPPEAEAHQEEQLETALAREFIELMGDDYAEVMGIEYHGLMGKMARDGPVIST